MENLAFYFLFGLLFLRSREVVLILRAQGGYLSNFILKWLAQKPDMEIVTYLKLRFTIPDLGQRVCKHLKGREVSRFRRGQKSFTTRVNCIIQGFCSELSNSLFWSSGFQRIPNNSSARKYGYLLPLLSRAS